MGGLVGALRGSRTNGGDRQRAVFCRTNGGTGRELYFEELDRACVAGRSEIHRAGRAAGLQAQEGRTLQLGSKAV